MSVDKRFFGIHIANGSSLDSNPMPFHDMGYGSIRLWDTLTNWRHLEKEKGIFDWARLDDLVNKSVGKGLEVLLTLGQPPNWATGGSGYSTLYDIPESTDPKRSYNGKPPENFKDWVNYVRQVATRYKGRIKAYEVWNEINLVSFYNDGKGGAGNLSTMVELTKLAYENIKEIDPNALIVSPNFTGQQGLDMFDQFLALGAGKWFDVASVHLYVFPSPPEAMVDLAFQYKARMAKNGVDKPTWNTESTWNFYNVDGVTNTTVMPDDLSVSYLTRMFICNVVAGMERAYFYGMNHAWSTLRLVDLTNPNVILPAGQAFPKIVDWMIGSTVFDFGMDADGSYFVKVQFRNGENGYIIWRGDHAVQPKKLSPIMGIYKGTDINGIDYTAKVMKSYISTSNVEASFVLSKTPVKLLSFLSKEDLPALSSHLTDTRYDLDIIPLTSSWATPQSGSEVTVYLKNNYPFEVELVINGGTITKCMITRDETDAKWYSIPISTNIVRLSPNDKIQVRYTSKPVSVFLVPR